MNISRIGIYNSKQNRIQRSKKTPTISQPVFKGGSFLDSLSKLDLEILNKLKMAEALRGSGNSIDKEIKLKEKILEELNAIAESQRLLSNSLKPSESKLLKAEDREAILNYLKAVAKISKDKGFNRIAGYQDLVSTLKKQFIMGEMALSKTSFDYDIPNAILLYGPTGTGKTTFAKALAEETLSNVEEVPKDTPENMMKMVTKLAKESLQKYIDSGDKKQRTIIIVNEANKFGLSDAKTAEDFKNFIENCSKKYKCTLALTTNYPNHLPTEVLDVKITPYKIPVAPPNKENLVHVLKHYLKNIFRNEVDVPSLAAYLDKPQNAKYSNTDIWALFQNPELQKGKLTNKSIEDFIEDNYITPSIPKEDITKFITQQANFAKEVKYEN